MFRTVNLFLFAVLSMPLVAQEPSRSLALEEQQPAAKAEPSFTRQEDVIYGRKYGTALTMDVFTPKQGANGAAVVFAVSGGRYSRK